MEWFSRLKKSALNPPRWVIPLVWPILYLLIGISGYLIWAIEGKFSSNYYLEWIVYFAQLLLNFSWYPIFFNMRRPGLALFVIFGMLVAIYSNIQLFSKRNEIAGKLMYPYFIWVCFATYLNIMIWFLNKNQIDKQNYNDNFSAEEQKDK